MDRPSEGEHDPDDTGSSWKEQDATEEEDFETDAPQRPETPVTQQIGRVVVILLVVMLVVFAIANSQRVDFSWVFGETQVTEDPATGETSGGVPLILLLLAALAIGVTTNAIRVGRRARKRARRGPG